MQFGLFSVPFTGDPSYSEIAADAYDEWLWEVVQADRLGFHEAWIAEHLAGPHGSRQDTLPSADLFIAKAAGLTKRIRFGPMMRPIAFYHPLQVAIEAAVCDQLSRGRYNFGFGSGFGGPMMANQRGIDDSRRRERIHEAMELILKCWTSDEPFDYQGEFYQGQGIIVLPRPYQRPHMPVGVPTDSPETIDLAGRNGFWPVCSQHDTAEHMQRFWETYAGAARAAGRTPSRNALRACRYVYVAETSKKARDDVRGSVTVTLDYVKDRFARRFRYIVPEDKVKDLTFDDMVDLGIDIVGDPDHVYRTIKQYYDESGGFGTLVFIMGKRYGSRAQRARSMQLFMQEVAPRLAGLDPDGNGQSAV